jgi:drug/metabolite transporter (DMT)-like permease
MPAGVSALVTGMQPVLTAVLGSWLLRETVTARQGLGFVLGMAGVLLVVGDRIVVESLGASAVGLSMFALVSITLGTLWQKRHGAGVDLRTGTAIQFLAAAVILAPFAALEGGQVRWTGEFVFALAWLVLVLSFGAIFLLLTLIRRGRATQVSSLFYLVPPTTALIAWPLFGETYSLTAAAGMGLAMLAVWLVMKT